MSVCLSIYLAICLSIQLSIHSPIHLSIYLSMYPCIYIISLAPELLVARAAGALLQKRARATAAPVVSKVRGQQWVNPRYICINIQIQCMCLEMYVYICLSVYLTI